MGAALNCIAAAAVAWTTMVPSLAVLPVSLGILVIHHCGRGVPAGPRIPQAPGGRAGGLSAAARSGART
jgi:hypothetical protein